MLARLARAAAGAAAAGTAIARCDEVRSFDQWRDALQQQLGADTRVDFESALQPTLAGRSDKYLLWQSLRGDRMIKSVAMWRWLEGTATAVAGDDMAPVAGRARMSVLVQLGDELNGHEGIVHGGFTAALLDDLIGWCTMAETEAQGLPGDPLTSTLSLRYKRPVFSDRCYLANMRTRTVERRQRPGPPSWAVTLDADIVDEQGDVCVQAQALYVVKTFTASSLAEKAEATRGG